MSYTHPELVDLCPRAARDHFGATHCVCEPKAYGESPDCFAVTSHPVPVWSVLFEGKAHRQDFLNDSEKWHRAGPGLGHFRILVVDPTATPTTVNPDEAREGGWGLYHAMNGELIEVVTPRLWEPRHINWEQTAYMMHLALRNPIDRPEPAARRSARPVNKLPLKQAMAIEVALCANGFEMTAGQLRSELNITTRADILTDQIKAWAVDEPHIEVTEQWGKTTFRVVSTSEDAA